MTTTRTIAFVTYPGLTALDLVGPLQVLAALPGIDPTYEVVTVARNTGAVDTDTPVRFAARCTFDEVAAPHAFLVPGGPAATFAALADEEMVSWVRAAAATAEIAASVCTGSLLLGEAGLLNGRRATSHWGARSLLPAFGATPVAERWVEDGPVITAAGVSAGIDMALHLVGRLAGTEAARQVQLFAEYDPWPPHGPIDWQGVDLAQGEGVVAAMAREGLADHPELLNRLMSSAASDASPQRV